MNAMMTLDWPMQSRRSSCMRTQSQSPMTSFSSPVILNLIQDQPHFDVSVVSIKLPIIMSVKLLLLSLVA